MGGSSTNGELYRAGLPSPGARLLKAIAMVRQGNVVADIGCDHGKLAVYLVLANIAKRVIAVDKRPLPLSKAKGLVRQTGCEKRVDCRLGDGLKPLQPGEATEIVIAGMSGETMVEILNAAPWIFDPAMNFVFVPATRAEKLRAWLYKNGFAICQEEPVKENSHVYSVLQAVYTGEKIQHLQPLLCEIGLLKNSDLPEAKEYIKRRLHYLQNLLLGPLADAEREELLQLIDEVKKCLQ